MAFAFNEYADTDLTQTHASLSDQDRSFLETKIDRLRSKDISQEDALVDLELVVKEASESLERQAAVVNTCLPHALTVMDFLQTWLDGRSDDHILFRNSIYLLVKLARASNLVPSKLWLTGVDFSGQESTAIIRGGQGCVFKARYEGRLVAVKIPLGSNTSETSSFCSTAAKEAMVWRQLRHPRILPLLGLTDERENEDLLKLTRSERIGMVSPYMGGGHFGDYVKQRETLSLNEQNQMLRDIADGLAYLHSLRIVHGDLKDKNVFVGEHNRAVLADFGLLVVGQHTVGALKTTKDEMSPNWVAPERMNPAVESLRAEASADIYSFGHFCLMGSSSSSPSQVAVSDASQICTGKPPSPGVSDYALYLRAASGRSRPTRPTPAECAVSPLSDSLWALADSCFSSSPADRPLIAAVLSSIEDFM